LIERKPSAQVQMQYLYFSEASVPQPHHEAMNGFVRTLQLEHPQLQCKLVELQQCESATTALDAVLAEFQADAREAVSVRYEGRIRYVRKLAPLAPSSTIESAAPLKERGVYLITGGAGGLGMIFAEFLARECRARL